MCIRDSGGGVGVKAVFLCVCGGDVAVAVGVAVVVFTLSWPYNLLPCCGHDASSNHV